MVESNISHSEFTGHRNYLIPKEILAAIIALGQYKGGTPAWKTLVGSLYAGFWVVFGGLFAITVSGGIDPTFASDYPMVPKVLTGLTFWIALISILSYGGDLFTGNLMYLMLARLQGRITSRQMLQNWIIVYFGNFAACVFLGYMLGYLTEFFKDDPYHSYVVKAAEKKVHLSWGVLVLRGVGANWLVCLAVCLAVASQDQSSRTVSCFLPVFAFATIGFEHCVANMFYVPLGLMYGAKTSFGEFIANNLIPVTIGNFIGGPIMCGLGLHVLYHLKIPPLKAADPAVSDREAEEVEEHKKETLDPTKENPSTHFIKRYVCKGGEVVRMAVDVTIVMDKNGKPQSIAARMRQVFGPGGDGATGEQGPEGFMFIHWNGTTAIEDNEIVIADRVICELLGYTSAELNNMRLRNISYADDMFLSTTMLRLTLNSVDRPESIRMESAA